MSAERWIEATTADAVIQVFNDVAKDAEIAITVPAALAGVVVACCMEHGFKVCAVFSSWEDAMIEPVCVHCEPTVLEVTP